MAWYEVNPRVRIPWWFAFANIVRVACVALGLFYNAKRVNILRSEPKLADDERRVDREQARTQREFAQAIECRSTPVRRGVTSKSIKGFVEWHIEQARQLVEAGIPVAIGMSVPGNFRYGPSGSSANMRRRDEILAASEFAIGLDDGWRKNDAAPHGVHRRPLPYRPESAHAGQLTGELTRGLDVRAYDQAHLSSQVHKLAQEMIGESLAIKCAP